MSVNNQPLQRIEGWLDARLYDDDSRIDRRGIFVREPVRVGEVLIRWGGLLIPLDQYDPTRYRSTNTFRYDEARYMVTPLDQPKTLDEFLNHSCDPNTWLVDEQTVVARREITALEEVTMDYAVWENSDYIFTSDCQCGTALCRGLVTGRDWRSPVLQARYEGHFVPYLNRAIRLRSGGL